MDLKTVHTFILYELFVLFLSCVSVYSYNVETDKVGWATGKPGTQFGYTVAIVKKPGWSADHMINLPFHQKKLLVGAPNETFDSFKGHGQIHICQDPLESSTVKCESLNVTDETNICVKLRTPTPNCSVESRLGMTMEVNKHYYNNKADTLVPMVTACAPGWKNVINENVPKSYQNYMIGMCLKLKEDFTTIPCDAIRGRDGKSFDKSYCWPFWPTSAATTIVDGRPVYTFAQAGMSMGFSENGNEVISAPGAFDWRGAYRSVRDDWKYHFPSTEQSTVYFGYSLSVGKLPGANIVVGIPNWYSSTNYGYFGKVEIYKDNRKQVGIEYGLSKAADPCVDAELEVEKLYNIDKDQTGTKFGATVETIDITGDGYDEIFVAAPLYSGERPDEGRVFVYTMVMANQFQYVCGPIGILSGAASDTAIKEKSAFARFGTSIASIGDLNKDKINDVAIGAPYEDNGAGAVYIYHGIGGCKLCLMEDVYSQRITGSQVSPGIRSFGWSIYGDEDVDDNSYPDFAVGAYQSDKVALFRTRPIVKLIVELDIKPAPIPLNGNELSCSRDKTELCFEVSALFQYESLGIRLGDVSEIKFSWNLNADTLHKSKEGYSRVVFRDSLKDSFMETITLNARSNPIVSRKYIMNVKGHNNKPEPRDAWTLVRMEGKFELIGTTGTEFQDLDAILPENTPTEIIENVEFDKQCDSIDLCTSDLTIDVKMFLIQFDKEPVKVTNETVIYVDDASELEVTVDVTNLVNASYRANFSGEVTALPRRNVFPNNGIIGATCKIGSHAILLETLMNCTADSKLDKNENFIVKFYFDISRVRLIPNLNMNNMVESIMVDYKAHQINHDVNPNNNMFKHIIPVKMKYDIAIEEDQEISAQERYAANQESVRKIRLRHRFYITNNGPSFLPLTFVNITIPTMRGDSVLAKVLSNKLPNICVIRGQEPIIQTTTTMSSTTQGFTIPDTDAQKRRRREAVATEEIEAPQTAESSTKDNAKNFTCKAGDSNCAVIECRISNLEKNNQEIVEITIDLFEKELAKEKDVRTIRYISTATVTDPYLWYGGKVVPWKDTVFAEKTTLLVVETASVVNEVDIWIIVGAVLGAIALLVIVIIILYLCGFFKRKKHTEVQQWKQASLYNRKSMRMSRAVSQRYSAVNDADK